MNGNCGLAGYTGRHSEATEPGMFRVAGTERFCQPPPTFCVEKRERDVEVVLILGTRGSASLEEQLDLGGEIR